MSEYLSGNFYDLKPKEAWISSEDGCILYKKGVGIGALSLSPFTPLSMVVFPERENIVTISDFYYGESGNFFAFLESVKDELKKKFQGDKGSLMRVYEKWVEKNIGDQKKLEGTINFLNSKDLQIYGINMGQNDNSNTGRLVKQFHFQMYPIFQKGLNGMGTAVENYYKL